MKNNIKHLIKKVLFKIKKNDANSFSYEEILNHYKVFVVYHDFSQQDFNYFLVKNELNFTLYVDIKHAEELKKNNLWNSFMQKILCTCTMNNFYRLKKFNSICIMEYDKTLQKESNTRKLKRDN